MIIHAPAVSTASSSYYSGPLDQRPSIRRIYCLNNLRPMPLPSRKRLQNDFSTPFPDNHILLKAGGNQRLKTYADSPGPYKEETNILTYAFLKPCTTMNLAGKLTFLLVQN